MHENMHILSIMMMPADPRPSSADQAPG